MSTLNEKKMSFPQSGSSNPIVTRWRWSALLATHIITALTSLTWPSSCNSLKSWWYCERFWQLPFLVELILHVSRDDLHNYCVMTFYRIQLVLTTKKTPSRSQTSKTFIQNLRCPLRTCSFGDGTASTVPSPHITYPPARTSPLAR